MKHSTVPMSTAQNHHGAGARRRLPDHPATLAPQDSAQADPDLPFAEGVHDAINPDLRHRLVSAAAFDRYAKRGYVDGYDQEDWFSAEDEIDHQLLRRNATGKE